MKGIIVYKGKYGATAQYAQWLGAELNYPVCKVGTEAYKAIRDADTLVIGTSVYIGKLQISRWLRDNESELQYKKLYLFLVAGTPVSEKGTLQAYIQAGVPHSLQKKLKVYFLPGRLQVGKLSWKDRLMLKIGARLTKDPQEKKRMLADYDDVKKENIAGMVEDLRQLKASSTTAAQTTDH